MSGSAHYGLGNIIVLNDSWIRLVFFDDSCREERFGSDWATRKQKNSAP